MKPPRYIIHNLQLGAVFIGIALLVAGVMALLHL